MTRRGDRVPVPATFDCGQCKGTGFAHENCPECGGHVTAQPAPKPGCDTCVGIGGYGSCRACHGTGKANPAPHEVQSMQRMERVLQRRVM